jgi:hypothetical protein
MKPSLDEARWHAALDMLNEYTDKYRAHDIRRY